MATKLTKSIIGRVQAAKGADGRARVTYLFDSEKPGLALKITPSGAKSFIYQARVGAGREAKKTRRRIGTWPATTIDAARKAADTWHSKVRVQGVDPAAERAKDRQQKIQAAADRRTVNDVCDAYVEAAKTMPTRRGTPKSETNLNIDKGRIDWHIRPLLGKKVAKELTKGDIADFRDKVAAGDTAKTIKGKKKRAKHIISGGQGTANRCLNLLGAIMSFAKDRKWISESPVSGVVKYHRPKIGKRPSTEMMKAIGVQLREMEKDHPQATAIIHELALTGARYSEIAKLRHRWMELPGALLRIPDLENKSQRERIIILGRPAIDILRAQQKIAHNPYVFPATRGKGTYQATPKVWRKACEKAGVSIRIHDLRHHFSSIATELNYPKPIVSALLGHAKADITDEYIHVAPKILRDAADAISEAIARLLAGESAKVVQIPRREVGQEQRA